MENTDSSSNIVVGIIAIVAVFVIAYFGLMLFNKQPVQTTDGTTAGVDINVGTNGGDGTPPPPNAQ